MANSLFIQLTIAVAGGALLATLFRLIKQPPLVAYLLAGLLIGWLLPFPFAETVDFHLLTEIGLTFLLFLVGLELKLDELEDLFSSALANSLARAVLVGGASAGLGYFVFGLGMTETVFLGIITAISSTIIGVKLLSNKGETSSLHGKIAIGTLVIQDVLAILALTIITSAAALAGSFGEIGLLLLKVTALLAVVFYLTKNKILTQAFSSIADNTELTFIASIAWALGVAVVVSSPLIGLSPAIGGFLAGLSLSNSWQRFEIAQRIAPLRDLFILLFFLLLGVEIVNQPLQELLPFALLLVLIISVLSPVASYLGLSIRQYTNTTKLRAGILLSQISVFGLIIANLAFQEGLISQRFLALITLTTVLSMVASIYTNAWRDIIIKFFAPNEKSPKSVASKTDFTDHVILVGAHRLGNHILEKAKKKDMDLLVIEQNPEIFGQLKDADVSAIFGNANDIDTLKSANIAEARLFISTAPIVEENKNMLYKINSLNSDLMTIFRANYPEEAEKLYEEGANLVVVPPLLGSLFLSDLATNKELSKSHLTEVAETQEGLPNPEVE